MNGLQPRRGSYYKIEKTILCNFCWTAKGSGWKNLLSMEPCNYCCGEGIQPIPTKELL